MDVIPSKQTKVVTCELKMSIPDESELNMLYELMHAGEALENRFCRDTTDICEEILEEAGDIVSEEERQFFLKAWKVLVDNSGGLGRLLGAYASWEATCQHPGLDYVAWNARMREALETAPLLSVMEEAYKEARDRVRFLEESFVIMRSEDVLNDADSKTA